MKMKGIYFLANDKMIDWAIAFLNSLRFHMSDIKVYMIPFDHRISKLARLENVYHFEILPQDLFQCMDSIGRCFFPNSYYGQHTFRKFSAFWGPLDDFLYLDADIVVLDDLFELFEAGPEYDLIFESDDINWIYKEGLLRNTILKEFHGKAYNAGTWRGKKGQFTFDEITRYTKMVSPFKDQFAATDQSFLTFCIYSKGLSTATFQDVLSLGNQIPVYQKTDLVQRVSHLFNSTDGNRVKLIHWAGNQLNPLMPYRSIFLHFRLMHMSHLNRMIYKYAAHCKYIIYRIRKLLGRILKMPLRLDPQMPYKEVLRQYQSRFISIIRRKNR